MKLIRTANAGILLELDETKLLLDGVCPPYEGFLGTPPSLRDTLLREPPHALAFTHRHPDHYDGDFAETFRKRTLRPIFEAEAPREARVGNLTLTPIPTRHIGKYEIAHVSYLIQGSKRVLFCGDASPLEWNKIPLPPLDVAIFPFAYMTTPAARDRTCALGAKMNILLHLPRKDQDPFGLWKTVEEISTEEIRLCIPSLEETILFKDD